jgi:hypothetical protein
VININRDPRCVAACTLSGLCALHSFTRARTHTCVHMRTRAHIHTLSTRRCLHSTRAHSRPVTHAHSTRWGRNSEGGAEDPYLMGMLGLSWTRGVQEGDGRDPDLIQVAVTLKHYVANDLEGGSPDDGNHTRNNYNVNLSNCESALAFCHVHQWTHHVHTPHAPPFSYFLDAVIVRIVNSRSRWA